MESDSPIIAKFTKFCKDLKIHQKGRGFYSPHHIFATISDGAGDRDAVNAILSYRHHYKPVLVGCSL
jgi:hypothetical protein